MSTLLGTRGTIRAFVLNRTQPGILLKTGRDFWELAGSRGMGNLT